MFRKIISWVFKGHRVETVIGGTVVKVPGSVATSRTLWGALIAAVGFLLVYTLAPLVGKTGPADWSQIGKVAEAVGALLALLGLGGKLQVLTQILLAILRQFTGSTLGKAGK
jgi:hypothetical protein